MVRGYFYKHLITPLDRENPLYEEIVEELEKVYFLIREYPEIVDYAKLPPNYLSVLTSSFSIDPIVQSETDLRYLADHLIDLYKIRGSTDTLKSPGSYYGSGLPYSVEIKTPHSEVFRWDISEYSERHVYETPGSKYSEGAIELILPFSTLSTSQVKKFYLRELIAAGSKLYSMSKLLMDISSGEIDSNPYKYLVLDSMTVYWSKFIPTGDGSGFIWDNSLWDATGSRWTSTVSPFPVVIYTIYSYILEGYSLMKSDGLVISKSKSSGIVNAVKNDITLVILNAFIYYLDATSPKNIHDVSIDLYDSNGNKIESKYPGWFVLAESRLGERV